MPFRCKPTEALSVTPLMTLRGLSLDKQVRAPEAAALLRFVNASAHCSRHLCQRLAYAFCHSCLAEQQAIHTTWEWTFIPILHCPVHESLLQVGCAHCGDPDPLPFGLTPPDNRVPCRSCGVNLLDEPIQTRTLSATVLALEKAYRAALFGELPNMALIDGTTPDQFRQFVDDTLRLLADPSRRQSSPSTAAVPVHASSREESTILISQLVLNACTDWDLYERRARYRKSLKLWKTLLGPLTAETRRNLALASLAWPSVMRRRLNSALDQTIRRSSFRG
jgi:hypothetical protein